MTRGNETWGETQKARDFEQFREFDFSNGAECSFYANNSIPSSPEKGEFALFLNLKPTLMRGGGGKLIEFS